MKYALLAALFCAPLLFSIAVSLPQQQENISVSTSEGAAMKSLRTLFSAETAFQTKGGTGEYGELKDLRAAGLIDDELANGIKGGYRFTVVVKKSTLTTPPLLDLVARPSEYDKSGRRSFYLTEAGVLLTSEKKDAPLAEMRPFAKQAMQGNSNRPVRTAPLVTETPDEEDAGAQLAANEDWMIDALRSIHTAEATFKEKQGAGQYGSLEQLVKLKLLESARVDATQKGYVFEVLLRAGKGETPAAYAVNAVPQTYGVSGRRSFYIDQTGTLRGADKEGGPADATDPPVEK
ncbi:MAG: hypothetical protein JO360_09360 [Acidobacteria bacterium]|nr:hypothetical protein [Acidobacteriota bacterium]